MLHLISVWLHLLAAVVWIGGMAFLSLVLVPSIRLTENSAIAADLLRLSARRFQVLVHASIIVLIATGVINLIVMNQGPGLKTAFGRILSLKLILVALMLGLTAFHGASARHPERLSAAVTRWAPRINLLLGVAVLLCAVSLVRIGL